MHGKQKGYKQHGKQKLLESYQRNSKGEQKGGKFLRF